MIQKIKNKLFKKKLAKLGFDMEDEENDRLASAFQEKFDTIAEIIFNGNKSKTAITMLACFYGLSLPVS